MLLERHLPAPEGGARQGKPLRRRDGLEVVEPPVAQAAEVAVAEVLVAAVADVVLLQSPKR